MNKLFSIAQSNARLDDVFESLSAQSNVRLDDAFELLSAQAQRGGPGNEKALIKA